MSIDAIYQSQIKSLPVIERLRLARLIMDELAESAPEWVVEASDAWNPPDLHNLNRTSASHADRVLADRAEGRYAMTTMTLTLPDDLSAQLEPYRNHLDEVLRVGLCEIKLEHSLNLFKTDTLSLAKAARLANVSLREMTQYAVAHGLRAAADEQTVQEELA